MRYRVTHRSCYRYASPVTVSHHLAHLAPRALPSQLCPWHRLEISPVPVARSTFADAHGNLTTYFEVEGAHESLTVTSTSFVEVRPSAAHDADSTPGWDDITRACDAEKLNADAAAGEFRFASPMVPLGGDFADYARPSFPAGKPVLACVSDFIARLHAEFRFDTRATDVATPVAEVLVNRAGVCQDFAHLALACLRSIGLPARYVSGYLETLPPPGQEKLIGADASHAWIAVYCGGEAGWIDADPTNNLLPGSRHVTVAWGRDFSDVSPLRGVTIGAGDQLLEVSVDVTLID
ncbi:MAG: transglutaminase N-terminal domain-containing protein [Verrucomicrobiales bacterium]